MVGCGCHTWQSSWEPSITDENLEEVLSDETQRKSVTHTQLQTITDLVNDPWQNIEAERRERLKELQTALMNDFFPKGSRAGIEA